MEEARKLEIAQRIRDLRERSPWGQAAIAEKLGLRLRSYQKLEKVGTERFERCEELASIHAQWTSRTEGWAHADADWIWDGKVRGATPDLLAELSPAGGNLTQLDRIEQTLAELRRDVSALVAERDAAAAEPDAEPRAPERPKRRRGGAQG